MSNDWNADFKAARPSQAALEQILRTTGHQVPKEYWERLACELASAKVNFQSHADAQQDDMTFTDRADELSRLQSALTRAGGKMAVMEAIHLGWINIPQRPKDIDAYDVYALLLQAVERTQQPPLCRLGRTKHARADKNPALNSFVVDLFNIWTLWLGLNIMDRKLAAFCGACADELGVCDGGEALKAQVRRLRRELKLSGPPFFYSEQGVPSVACEPPIGYRPPFSPDLLNTLYNRRDWEPLDKNKSPVT